MSGGAGREFGRSVAIDGILPKFTVAAGVPLHGIVHVVTLTAAAAIGGEGTLSEPYSVACMEPCGPSPTTTRFGAAVSVASDGVGNRVLVVGAPLDDGCGTGLVTMFGAGMDGCTDRGGVYLYEWSGSAYTGVAVYKGLALTGRVGSSVSSRRMSIGSGVVVGVGSPRDDNTALSGKVMMYGMGGVAGGAGHMLRRAGGSGSAWTVVHTAKPMHPFNVGHAAEMGNDVDVTEDSVGGAVRGFYCARGDGNARGGEHPAEFEAGEAGSGAVYVVSEP